MTLYPSDPGLTPPLPPPPPPLPPSRLVAMARPPQRPWQQWLGLIADHNPFYLLSVLCMMLGCYLISNALVTTPGELWKLIGLLGIINVYEALLLAFGGFLLIKTTVPRDGRTLLIYELFFLIDLTFLNAECVMNSITAGVIVNSVLLVLAAGKLLAVCYALGLQVGAARLAYMIGQLAVLYLMPVAVRLMGKQGEVPELGLYLLWWMIGLLPVVYDLLDRAWPGAMRVSLRAARVKPEIVHFYAVLPFVSLVAHLGFLHWVFLVPYHVAEAAPVLLGLAVIAGRLGGWVPAMSVRTLQAVLPAMALLVATSDPVSLAIQPLGEAHGSVTPLVAVLGAAPLAYGYIFAFRYLPVFFGALLVLGTARLFGPTVGQVVGWADAVAGWCLGTGRAMVPRTALGWGISSMASSFVLLVLGALVSLWRGRQTRA